MEGMLHEERVAFASGSDVSPMQQVVNGFEERWQVPNQYRGLVILFFICL